MGGERRGIGVDSGGLQRVSYLDIPGHRAHGDTAGNLEHRDLKNGWAIGIDTPVIGIVHETRNKHTNK